MQPHPPYQISFSERELSAIVQACCCLPGEHQSNPAIYLIGQLRALRRIEFEPLRFEQLRRILALLDQQVCYALAWELFEIGALTNKGLNVDAISSAAGNPFVSWHTAKV